MVNPVELFEEEFKKFLGVKHAVAVNSGTAALHTALLSVGIEPGDKIITTPFTFPSPVGMITACGATPIFVDIDPETYCMDMSKVLDIISERDQRITAILAVHLFGNMCDMDVLMSIREEEHIFIIEDASQALGAAWTGEGLTGTLGDVGCFSFYATKNLWTGGGMLVTREDRIAEIARQIRNHGKDKTGRIVRLGYNYNMHWDDAYQGEKMLRLHKPAILAELGRFSPKDGYYPYVMYDEPFYQRFAMNCPIAEEVARKVREGSIC